jgi:hypothetical protein
MCREFGNSNDVIGGIESAELAVQVGTRCFECSDLVIIERKEEEKRI